MRQLSISTDLESPSNPNIGSSLGRRIMKSIVQASLAVFVMLTLAVVYAAAQQPASPLRKRYLAMSSGRMTRL